MSGGCIDLNHFDPPTTPRCGTGGVGGVRYRRDWTSEGQGRSQVGITITLCWTTTRTAKYGRSRTSKGRGQTKKNKNKTQVLNAMAVLTEVYNISCQPSVDL